MARPACPHSPGSSSVIEAIWYDAVRKRSVCRCTRSCGSTKRNGGSAKIIPLDRDGAGAGKVGKLVYPDRKRGIEGFT